MEQVKHNVGIDYFKLLFALCVVAIHTQLFIEYSFYNIFMELITSAAVPFFFIVSGYFLGRKTRLINYDNNTIFNKYIIRLAKPFCFWGLIYFAFYLAKDIYMEKLGVIDSLFYRVHLLLVASPGGALWYVETILIVAFLLKITLKNRKVLWVWFFIFLFMNYLSVWIDNGLILMLPFGQIIRNVYNTVFMSNMNFLFQGIYFISGFLYGTYFSLGYSDKKKYNFYIILTMFALVIIIYNFMIGREGALKITLYSVVKQIYYFLIFLTVLHTNIRDNINVFMKCRKYSGRIYFSHMLFILGVSGVGKIFAGSRNSITTYCFVIVIEVILCLIVDIVQKNNIGNRMVLFIFGE